MLAIGGVLTDLAITYLPAWPGCRPLVASSYKPADCGAASRGDRCGAGHADLRRGAGAGDAADLAGRRAGRAVGAAGPPACPRPGSPVPHERVEFGKPIGSVSRENGDRAHCSRREAVALTRRRPEAVPHSPAGVEGSPVADDALRAGSGRMSGKHTTISSRQPPDPGRREPRRL